GVRFGRGRGPEGLALGSDDAQTVGVHGAENPLMGDLKNAADPLRQLLAVLSVVGITNSDADDARMARDRCPQVAEAYRLFSLLQKAAPDQQELYVAAFQSGVVFGRRTRSRNEQPKPPAAATNPPPIERARQAATAWRRDRKARPFYRFARASMTSGGW